MRTTQFLNTLILFFAIGCAKTDSDNIKTSGFFASYTVRVSSVSPTLAQCQAQYTVEQGGTYIELTEGDTVTCNGQSMTKSVFAGIVTYSANLTATAGNTYTVVLTRSGESPYSASVTLPDPLVATAPAISFSQSKGVALSFAWSVSSNSSDAMSVSTSKTTSGDTNCPDTAYFYDSAPENGSGSFSASEMSLPVGGTAGACSMSVDFSRERTGTMPSGLNGKIRAIQTTSVLGTLN